MLAAELVLLGDGPLLVHEGGLGREDERLGVGAALLGRWAPAHPPVLPLRRKRLHRKRGSEGGGRGKAEEGGREIDGLCVVYGQRLNQCVIVQCTCARRPGGCCWKDTLAPWVSLAWAVGEWAWWFEGWVSDTGSSAKPCNGHERKGRGRITGALRDGDIGHVTGRRQNDHAYLGRFPKDPLAEK